MNNIHFKSVVMFGGSGFIGSHLATYLLKHNIADHITVADIQPPITAEYPSILQQAYAQKKVVYTSVDVRQAINSSVLPDSCDLIVNLAAVHREPGHEAYEYFETNLPGAEHICNWARKVGCNWIVFTSSIATYGVLPGAKTEDSLTTPLTPYGISKLVAEKIHQGWQVQNPDHKLLIVRPGVIFGPRENGNVTRMVQAILGNYFAYTGTKKVAKAGGYVKELCHAIVWMLNWQRSNNIPFKLFNFTVPKPPTIEEYANTISAVSGKKKFIPNIPYRVLLIASYIVHGIASILHIKQPINPTRVRKLLRYNEIIPKVLLHLDYPYQYSLKTSLEDWQKEYPKDWHN